MYSVTIPVINVHPGEVDEMISRPGIPVAEAKCTVSNQCFSLRISDLLNRSHGDIVLEYTISTG
jgi:hypothetical protein